MRLRRVPVLRQQTATECGAASLAMLLSALGRPTSVDECLERTGGGRDGTSARSLLVAARAFGASAQALACQDPRLPGVPLPAVAHWEFDHFVVVERVTSRSVWVVDPARGRRRLNHRTFSDGFTGVLVVAEGDETWSPRPVSPHSQGARAVFELARRAPGLRTLLVQLVVAALVLQAIGVAPALASMFVLNEVLPLGFTDVFVAGLVLTGLLVVFRAVSGAARAALVLVLETRVDTAVLHGTFGHLLSLPYSFFERRSVGDTVMRLMSTAAIRQTFGTQALGAALDGLTSLGYLAFLFAINGRLALVAFAIGGAQAVLLLGAGVVLRGRVAEELSQQARTQSFLVEVLAGIASVKASGGERVAVDRFVKAHTRQMHASVRRAHLAGLAEAGSAGLQLAAPVLLLVAGADLVLRGEITVGAMVAVGILGGLLVSSFGSAAVAAFQLQMAGGLVARLADILRQDPEQRVSAGGVVEPRGGGVPEVVREIRGDVRIEGVTVRYSPAHPPAIEDVEIEMVTGTTTAIVGPSGAGKTTVAKAVLGLARPERGRVLIDGRDLWDYELTTLRRHFGVVLQDAVLFDGTIAENVTFDDPDVDEEALRAAAATAHLLDEIEAMPMGFNTRISEGGRALSGGQRQRLVLARALLRRPRLLVLDEATSQLDARTEAAVTGALDQLGCTRIVIAHRLSTVRRADRIVVLDRGRMVESGTHDELMESRGVYASLVASQLAL